MSVLPVVVLPQFAGSAQLVARFVGELERQWPRVHVLEPPGFGDEAPPEGLPSIRALARTVVARWRASGIGRAHLFGISIGGMIAQWVAIDSPELVERLVLASTSPSGLRTMRDARLRQLAMARCLFTPDDDA